MIPALLLTATSAAIVLLAWRYESRAIAMRTYEFGARADQAAHLAPTVAADRESQRWGERSLVVGCGTPDNDNDNATRNGRGEKRRAA